MKDGLLDFRGRGRENKPRCMMDLATIGAKELKKQGILKISFKRFLHISILKHTLTPLHDHVRKRMGWSDEQVVARWLILQAVASAWLLLLTR